MVFTECVVPDGMTCRFDGPKAWYDWMVATSAAGRFPAVRPPTEKEREFSDSPKCCYLSPDGLQCLVGGLYSTEDAARLEAAVPGKSVTNCGVSGWDRALPKWLSVWDARVIQRFHDEISLGDWDHKCFVSKLNGHSLFANCDRGA